MDNTGKFWLMWWGIASIVIITIILAITYSAVQRNNNITQLIQSGVDPIEVRYALGIPSDKEDILAWVSKYTKE